MIYFVIISFHLIVDMSLILVFVSVGGDWKKIDGHFIQNYIWCGNNDVRSIVVDPNEKFSNLVGRICNKFEIDKEEFGLKLSYNPSTKESILGSKVRQFLSEMMKTLMVFLYILRKRIG